MLRLLFSATDAAVTRLVGSPTPPPAEPRDATLEAVPSAPPPAEPAQRGAVGVVAGSDPDSERLLYKRQLKTLRSYAEHSVWVRAAISILRHRVARAEWRIQPFDPARRPNRRVKEEIEALLRRPNPAEDSYSLLKERLIEDFLVVGYGWVEKRIRKDAAPYQLLTRDAANLAFVRGWTGDDPTAPRYAELDKYGKAKRSLADAQVFVLVNQPRSYTELGLSPVETLDRAIRALLEGDDHLLQRLTDPTPNGALNLGEGASQPQVDQLRAEIEQTRRALVVMGGTSGASFLRFDATEAEMRLLDSQTWFVRQVAAAFHLSTAALKLAVDTSRANTEAMFEQDEDGVRDLLWQICEAENAQICGKFGDVKTHNCQLVYPVMSAKDELRQAKITSLQTSGVSWISINEARRASGEDDIDHPLANEPLVKSGNQLLPLSQLLQAASDSSSDPEAEPTPTAEEDAD